MTDTARRVVLLARPGAARERMRDALGQAGADVVLEADPASTSPDAVLAARPEAALVVLDAATEEALERFGDVLSDRKIEVLFEEAELALGRAGWDAARWVRHLRAKLGHADTVLPPGRDGLAPEAPASRSAAAGPVPPAAPAPHREPPPLPPALPPAPAAPAAPTPAPPPPTSAEPPPLPPAEPPPLPPAAPAAAPAWGELSLVDIEPVGAEESASGDVPSASGPVPGDVREARPASVGRSVSPFLAAFEREQPGEPATEIRLEGLERDDESSVDASGFHDEMTDLQNHIASLELVEDRAATSRRGAVLVLAGIGGPDAVRQLLGALPEGFPRPVLVQQRLDGGHYDRLVAQMQRATPLPVKLAAAGLPAEPATVYILPPTLGVQEEHGRLSFNEAATDLLASLPASDSAVLVLSGADVGQVDDVLKLAGAGGFVGAQALDGCYDVAAPAALAARGGEAGSPQHLARRLAQRWHH